MELRLERAKSVFSKCGNIAGSPVPEEDNSALSNRAAKAHFLDVTLGCTVSVKFSFLHIVSSTACVLLGLRLVGNLFLDSSPSNFSF